MNKMNLFSIKRLWAVMHKEFIQMKRDRLTFAMMVGLPIVQLILFGFAINMNPRHLPTAVVTADNGVFARTFLNVLVNTDYFDVVAKPKTMKEADELLATGKVLFTVSIPPRFTKDLMRGQRPQILVEADATDPTASVNAMAALPALMQTVFDPIAKGPLTFIKPKPNPIDLVQHLKWNPERITQYNIVPGLIGVILTMTMVIITSLAITRERERGTMESLLATPVRPIEVMVGKITPFIIVGYIQIGLVLFASYFLFKVPIYGNLLLLLLCTFPFIVANLAVGLTFSSIAKNQLQAVQMAFFFFLPSILLSGFMFPFQGMPQWARWLGSALPLTHFLRVVRGIMLKGNTAAQALPHLWPIMIFLVVALFIGVSRYRQTLD